MGSLPYPALLLLQSKTKSGTAWMGTQQRRNYVCNLYRTDPIRLLLLKQILRTLRTTIFSAWFILILVYFNLGVTIVVLPLTTPTISNCLQKQLHGFPDLSELSKGVSPDISLPLPSTHAAAVLLSPRNEHVKVLQWNGRKSPLLTAR